MKLLSVLAVATVSYLMFALLGGIVYVLIVGDTPSKYTAGNAIGIASGVVAGVVFWKSKR